MKEGAIIVNPDLTEAENLELISSLPARQTR